MRVAGLGPEQIDADALERGDEQAQQCWTLNGVRLDTAGNMLDRSLSEGDPTGVSPLLVENDRLMKFNCVVANPPFSAKAWSNGLDPEHDVYDRFLYGVPPAKNGDYAFLLHLAAPGGRR